MVEEGQALLSSITNSLQGLSALYNAKSGEDLMQALRINIAKKKTDTDLYLRRARRRVSVGGWSPRAPLRRCSSSATLSNLPIWYST